MDWKGRKMNREVTVAHALLRAASALLPTLAFVLLPAGPAFSADVPTAEAILDRFVEVTGGKAAYEDRKTEVVHGTVEFAAVGLKGTMVEYFEEPGKFYMAMDLAGIGKIETGLNGGVAWENSVLQGARIKTGEEKAQTLREADMNNFSHWRQVYSKVELAGEEAIEGRSEER